MKESELLKNKQMRNELINRLDVLDKVGELLLLKGTDMATTNQVATYYQVDMEAIKTISFNNRDELLSDGLKEMSCKETKDFLVSCNIQPTNFKGYFEAEGEKFSNNKTRLFSKRAILRIGMLLRDSEIAKEIRTRLLDIVQDVEKENPEIIHNIINEIDEEKNIIMERVEAEINGDYDKVSLCNAKLFNLKNKRIKELEEENNMITTHTLTIVESKSVINRIIRCIAVKKYKGNFAQTWNELYTKINYKLNINIKGREKPKGKSYFSTLNDNELYETEIICRNWAKESNLDLKQILKLN